MHLFPNVANLPLRPPAMLAKQAATIDVLSGGRFELGLGAGGFADGSRDGRPAAHRRSRPPRSARRSTSSRRSGRASRSVPGQLLFRSRTRSRRPGARHPIGLWLGVRGPRAVALVGEKADGWSVSAPYVPPERLAELNGIIDDAALAAGRDPDQITRLYNVMGLISDQDEGPFHGPPPRWVDTLADLYENQQMNAFIYWPSADRERQSRLFAEQVVPLAREAIGSEDRG